MTTQEQEKIEELASQNEKLRLENERLTRLIKDIVSRLQSVIDHAVNRVP